ncbi:hypothetical protein Mapa_002777 [Marchantia paleacea]|nr:hypothetical protein Mapa_002777 [Marchantia paleacea]
MSSCPVNKETDFTSSPSSSRIILTPLAQDNKASQTGGHANVCVISLQVSI